MYFIHRVREKQTMIPEKHFAVAVDGPSGAGKSTLAKALLLQQFQFSIRALIQI